MLVTVINLLTGESKAGSKKKIAAYLNITINRLNLYRRDKVIIAHNHSISFNFQQFKTREGNKGAFNLVNAKKAIQKQNNQLLTNHITKVV